MPVPVFKYNGETLRADDRDGARAYLFTGDLISFEMSGTVVPPLKSDNNDARRGMEDLRFTLALGPQMGVRLADNLRLRFAVFQALSTDLLYTKANGQIFDTRLTWTLNNVLDDYEFFKTNSMKIKVGFVLAGASQEYLSNYFSVTAKDVTATRPAYDARAGFLSYDIFYFHTLAVGPTTYYLGFSNVHFDQSVNRGSPLHTADQTWLGFAGITYTFLESRKEAVPEESTQGILNKVR